MYLIDPDGNYPRHIGDLVLEHPDWTETQPLPAGWLEVLPGELPSPNYKQFVRELPIAQNAEGQWVRQFELADLPADQIPDDETMAAILAARARMQGETEE